MGNPLSFMDSRNAKSEAELLREIQNNEDTEFKRAAFDTLMALGYEDDLRRWVNGFRRRMNLKDGDVCEIVNITLLRAWKGIPKFRGDSKLSTWLYKLALNNSINYSKKNKKHDKVFSDISSDKPDSISNEPESKIRIIERKLIETQTPEEQIEAEEIQQKISQIIDGLSPNLKTVILLREKEGLTYEQISKDTGLKMGTVKSQIKRARDKIKLELKEWALANYLQGED